MYGTTNSSLFSQWPAPLVTKDPFAASKTENIPSSQLSSNHTRDIFHRVCVSEETGWVLLNLLDHEARSLVDMSRSLRSRLVTTSNSLQGDVIADDIQLAVYAVVVVSDRTRFAGSRGGAIDYLVGCGNDVIY